jgi:hypothetical protein
VLPLPDTPGVVTGGTAIAPDVVIAVLPAVVPAGGSIALLPALPGAETLGPVFMPGVLFAAAGSSLQPASASAAPAHAAAVHLEISLRPMAISSASTHHHRAAPTALRTA